MKHELKGKRFTDGDAMEKINKKRLNDLDKIHFEGQFSSSWKNVEASVLIQGENKPNKIK